MDSMIDSLFDQYERGGMTRRHLVQALAVLILPGPPLARSIRPALGQDAVASYRRVHTDRIMSQSWNPLAFPPSHSIETKRVALRRGEVMRAAPIDIQKAGVSSVGIAASRLA